MRFIQLLPYGLLGLLAALLPTLPAAVTLTSSGARRAPWVLFAVCLPTLVGAGTGAWWLRFHGDGRFHAHWWHAEIPALWWFLAGVALTGASAAFLACVAGVRTLAEGREESTPTPAAAARSAIVVVSALGIAALISPIVAIGVALAGVGAVLASLRQPPLGSRETQSLASFLTTVSLAAATIWASGIAVLSTW